MTEEQAYQILGVPAGASAEEIGRAHGEVFRDIRPAATMVEVSRLIDPRHLLEVEVDAVIGGGR